MKKQQHNYNKKMVIKIS